MPDKKSTTTSTTPSLKAPSKPGEQVRINRFLANCLPISRRNAEEWVKNGRVRVNGKVCLELATEIDPRRDKVEADGHSITQAKEHLYVIMNKPTGYLTTMSDPFHRKTVFDLLPDFGMRLFPVGRLDADTEGVLLFTNDGDLANRLMHPKYHQPKVYRVVVKGRASDEQIAKLREGVEIEGRKTQPARVFTKKSDGGHTVIRMTINEGMNRQIRRMMEIVGLSVMALKRLQFAGIELGKLPVGMCRLLKPRETMDLLMTVGRKK